jgi:hypothetical protein
MRLVVKRKIIHLEWLDSVSSGGWQMLDEKTDMKVESIGFLMGETKDRVIITTSVYGKTGESPMAIPKCAITKRRFVKL